MRLKMFIQKTKKEKGFSIVEALVAIAVLTAAIAGIYSTVQAGLSQATLSKDEVKAFYLAQEAFEIVRNIRDSNRIEILFSNPSLPWLYGIDSNCQSGNVCVVNAKNMTVTDCGSTSWGSCQNLRQDLSPLSPTYMLYGHDPGFSITNFKREIKIQEINSNEVVMTVRITWSKGLSTKTYQASMYLMKWI